MSYSTPDPDNYISDGDDLIEGYKPFIADVAFSSQSKPFQVTRTDNRTDEEIDRVRHSLRSVVSRKEFDPPLPLADFMLVAKQKWDEDIDEDDEFSIRLCQIF